MKIIKSRDSEKPRRFTCSMCGCVFEAEKGEYKTSYSDGRGEHIAKHSTTCPECERPVVEFEF